MKNLTELSEGEKLEDVHLPPVTKLDLIKYAKVSGDFNPIHLSEEAAQNAALPGIIAHGMWTMGHLAKLFTPFYEKGFIQDYSIRFKGMVFLNDVISLKAKLLEIHEKMLYFEVLAVNQEGNQVIKGTVVFILYL
ncbi:acyl dehydratase [Bacillus pakistanensis]|uniref:Acyl dehydratase n=1 Tax=Rossellomorea pakistanensis TaxID=992288 RepID=A0ABS2N8Y3_9BACI|nr:MaoC/PaaZ C-terminal domain-containing protein [Bacillus pakistanensis]MBM7584021.1 acyl dehydratase [Bacillus pakistanensis]